MKSDPVRRDIADRLIAALKADEFILYAQPIKPIGSPDGKRGYQEILVRFAEEEEKLLHPGGFFPILEQHNLMATLDRWVVRSVLRWCGTKQKTPAKNGNATRCSINLSSDSILGNGFPDFVAEQLKAANVPGERILFEISEHDADQYALDLDRFILPLKPLGCGFVVTSYTGERVSTEMLQALGVSLLKIDGHIVRRIHEDRKSFADALAIHQACREIGVRTIAELVEMQKTLHKLKEIGIDYAQGYGIAKPAPLK
jgi:EAL domain-containing protein (putative c-di-GMP-specific phosphodiesterase class I)